MQNWKEPITSTIYLANGGRLLTAINGISPEDGNGYVFVKGREVKVAPLPDTWSAMGYGEIIPITLQTGEVIEAVLTPEDYTRHVAYLYRNESVEATICLFDPSSGNWREYRNEGLGEKRGGVASDQDDMNRALAGIRSRLDTLASINAENILIPGGPQERYHQIIEEAYTALGLIETQVDALKAELEHQHARLDELRDAALAEIVQDEE